MIKSKAPISKVALRTKAKRVLKSYGDKAVICPRCGRSHKDPRKSLIDWTSSYNEETGVARRIYWCATCREYIISSARELIDLYMGV